MEIKRAIARAGTGVVGGYVSAGRRVVVATIPAHARNLDSVLIEMHRIGLIGIGLAMNTRACSVKRIENRDRSVQLRPEEGAAPIAGAIATGVDRGIQRRIRACRA